MKKNEKIMKKIEEIRIGKDNEHFQRYHNYCNLCCTKN